MIDPLDQPDCDNALACARHADTLPQECIMQSAGSKADKSRAGNVQKVLDRVLADA
jgi:hypothetical protein